jgi:two-component system, LuxR family, sensor kinase FixL
VTPIMPPPLTSDSDHVLAALLEAAVDAMIVIDGRGLIEEFNPAAERMFGYQAADILGRNVSLLMPSPDRERHDRYIARYLETGEQKIIGIGRDVTALRADGTRFPAHLSVGTMRVGGEPHFVGIVHDLSRRTTLEAQIREQASLARLGEMAAVLAHEVRNPLTAVRGAIQVLGKRFGAGTRDAQVVTEILARLDGLNDLVQDLLLFARTPHPRVAPIELRLVLSATAGLLARDPQLGGLAIEIAGDAPPIPVDAELLKLAFQNVILNAAQAMQGHGTIKATISAGEHGQTVTIADNGPGIPDEVRARLFQPFFTTKARGTGLGLTTVRRLIEAHGGTVAVDCPPAGGTIVTIAIPVRAATPASSPSATHQG